MKTTTKLFQMSAASFAILSLGMTSIASAQSDTYRHYNHYNPITMRCEIENENDVEISSEIKQEATSGNITLRDNTTLEDIKTGNTNNTQTSTISTEIDTSASVKNLDEIISALPKDNNGHNNNHSHHNHHPHHEDEVTIQHQNNNNHNPAVQLEIENENDVEIEQSIKQTATSGNIIVNDNTTVGDVATGSATNTSTSSITVSIK